MLPKTSFTYKNLQSTLKEPEIVNILLEEEVLDVATRKYLGKKRLIIDLSAPHNDDNSINSHIPRPPFSLCYTTIDDAIHVIKTAG